MSQSVPSKLGVSDDPFGARISLRDCLEAALQQSSGLMDKVLNGLVGKGEKAFGMHTKPNFPPPVQAAVEMLVAQRETIKLSFNLRLRECVYQGVGADMQSPQMMRFEDLKLFEEEDLDESIEIARALQEINQVADEMVPPLDALMSSLLGWITVQPQINPLRPEMYARALRECIAQQIEDVDMRGAILSPAAGRLGILLRKLYVELSSWLKSCGVESASQVQPGQVQSSVAKPSVVGAVGNSVARTLLTLDRLRRLLSGELDGDSSRRPQDFLHTVPASVVALQDMRQVEAMVQRLESKARKAAENPDADTARKKAAARMALADGKHLGKQLGEEVVRLMLDNLIADERLLPRVRAHLQTLEPVLMEIAKVDGRFFSDKQHAARQFLDKVTSRSLAFATERDPGYEVFVKSIDQSIQQLGARTTMGEDPSWAFAQVMQALEAVWQHQDANERTLREEAARALLHAEQRNMLAQFLAQEFRANAEGVEVPMAVVEFVCGPWAQAVAESQLQCTDGTSDPQGYQELVGELYWSVQPRVAKRNRKRLVQIIPGMLTKLRQGLQLIEFPPEKITDFFTDLISMHELALEGGRTKPAADAAVPAMNEAATAEAADEASALSDRAELEALYAASQQGALAAIAEDAPEPADFTSSKSPALAGDDKAGGMWLAQREVADAGFMEADAVLPQDAAANSLQALVASGIEPVAPAAIPIGSWAELMIEGQWVRVQLTWASPHRTLFMFVAHGGKAHSMSQRTMDKLRAQGMIRVVSEGRLVEKALDAVAQTALRNSVDESAATSSSKPV
jgi:Protein of unknown function (DUF1631)